MQYFPGEQSAGSRQPFTFARYLAARGHEVTVLSTDYNLDTGKNEEPVCLSLNGHGLLQVLRIPSPKGGRGSKQQRLQAYGVFMVRSHLAGMRLPRPDVVVGSIQPMFTGLASLGVARRNRVPFVLEVRDLWPDALVVKGAVSSLAASPLFMLARTLYQAADRVVSLTPGIKREIVKKGLKADKIDVFPNGFDPELFRNGEGQRDIVRKRFGWDHDFVAIYTGSFTKVTAAQVFVQAAAKLLDKPQIRFGLFGDGPAKAEVVSLAKRLGATNAHFHDPVPKIEIPALLDGADVALMSLFPTPLAHIYFENKFMDYMGAGKPILAAMDGEQAAIIKRFKTGVVVPSLDYAALARAIEEVSSQVEEFSSMGDNGRRLVFDHLLLPRIMEHYAQTVEKVAKGKAGELHAWEPLP